MGSQLLVCIYVRNYIGIVCVYVCAVLGGSACDYVRVLACDMKGGLAECAIC